MNEKLIRDYVRAFNAGDEELARRAVPNDACEEWMLANVPRISVPDKTLERTYYFRWWTYRKHIRNTPEGRVMTEFLPDVSWAGEYNTIPCAVGHHIREGRWLRDSSFLDEYIAFWLNGRTEQLHKYSNWLEAAVGALADVRGDDTGLSILDALIADLRKWEKTQMTASGLFWSNDDRDGSEYSITGPGLRLTLNSYMVAGYRVVAKLCVRAGRQADAEILLARASILQENMEKLWDAEKRFYIPIPQKTAAAVPFAREDRRARELFGYLPWAFGAAKEWRADAFRDLLSAEGFAGKCGVTFAERRHPCFGIFTTGKELNDWLTARGEATVDPEGHECLWNGPSWPFATSLMLTALANLLASEEAQESITPKDYVFLLTQYAAAHTITMPDGRTLPWIDENMDPDTGEWIARNRLRNWKGECFPKSKGGYERGKDYNHSTFCDLMLEGLFGIRPSEDVLTVAPLFPADWEYACVSDVFVHGKELRITYRQGEGYRVFLDGTERFRADTPGKCRIAW